MDFFSAPCIDIYIEFILENFLDDLRCDFEALTFLRSESRIDPFDLFSVPF